MVFKVIILGAIIKIDKKRVSQIEFEGSPTLGIGKLRKIQQRIFSREKILEGKGVFQGKKRGNDQLCQMQ